MSARWHVPTNISFFPIPPINFLFLRQPTSFLTVLTAAPHPLYVLVGGGGYFHFPLTHLRLHCSSRLVSYQRYRLFRYRILRRSHGSVPPISAWCRSLSSFFSFPLRIPDRCPCSISFFLRVKGDPVDPNLAQHIIPTLSPYGRM